MKQQQILAITLVLLVQQVYFLTAVNSTASGVPDSASNVTNKTDTPSNKSTVPTPTTSSSPSPTPSTITTTDPTIPPSATNQPPTKPSTTEEPKTTTVKPPQPSRHFDLPSFIGGIVLTIGLIGIGFVGHKIYKSKFDRNYHTL